MRHTLLDGKGDTQMKTIQVEKVKIDLATGKQVNYVAEVQQEQDEQHPIYTLTYEGYQSEWHEVA
jgi:hypothetical protein